MFAPHPVGKRQCRYGRQVLAGEISTITERGATRADDRLTEADFLEQVVKGGFVERGVTVGSEGDQANIYNSEMLGFFRDAFGTTPELKGLP